jgi:hypothetical protein
LSINDDSFCNRDGHLGLPSSFSYGNRGSSARSSHKHQNIFQNESIEYQLNSRPYNLGSHPSSRFHHYNGYSEDDYYVHKHNDAITENHCHADFLPHWTPRHNHSSFSQTSNSTDYPFYDTPVCRTQRNYSKNSVKQVAYPLPNRGRHQSRGPFPIDGFIYQVN